MADLCHACAIETWGEDAGDLAGLTTPEQADAGRYAVALCEGCGPILVDPAGGRVATLAAEQPMPRILNKHVHGIPAGARYIGRGSPFATPSSSGATAPATRCATSTTPGS